MHLIQCYFPLYDNDKKRFPHSMYEAECRTLSERFGGLTGYTRAPACGLWEDDEVGAKRDDLIIYEVMAENLDREWWREYRRSRKPLSTGSHYYSRPPNRIALTNTFIGTT